VLLFWVFSPAGRLALRDASQTGRAGGVYIPPFKLKQMQEQMNRDSADPAWQRMQWEALRKSINGLVNKVYGVLGQQSHFVSCVVAVTRCGPCLWAFASTSRCGLLLCLPLWAFAPVVVF